jgi:tyrosyl-tRNA synthetase
MKAGENPRNIKMYLAREIVTIYHSAAAASEAEEGFIRVFQKKDIPEDVEEKKMKKGEYSLVDLIAGIGLAPSKSEARRLVEQGGVKIDKEKVEDVKYMIVIDKKPVLIQVGKRRFMRIKS